MSETTDASKKTQEQLADEQALAVIRDVIKSSVYPEVREVMRGAARYLAAKARHEDAKAGRERDSRYFTWGLVLLFILAIIRLWNVLGTLPRLP